MQPIDYTYKTQTRAGKTLEVVIHGVPARITEDQNGEILRLMERPTIKRVEQIQNSIDRYLSRHDETERKYFVDFETGQVLKPVTRVRPSTPALQKSA
ncbi:MAG: hypothetical protein H7095_08205 [Pseudopedobacter sp.]|nr:hypothetical protein [Deinococcales bacterium]